MITEVIEVPVTTLSEYAGIPITFEVREVLDVIPDLALLWDIRVAPLARRRGVGSALFDAAVTWARSWGCLQLKVETQNINVAACRFYAQQGCVLRAVHKGTYPQSPDAVQLLWFKDLRGRPKAG